LPGPPTSWTRVPSHQGTLGDARFEIPHRAQCSNLPVRKLGHQGEALSTQVNLLGRRFGLFAAPFTRGRIPMEYKGVEYSVVQLTGGIGWRWEIRLDEGKNRSGSTPVSRAVAIKQAKHEIDRILKSGK
jgi:hypothetical protein